MGGRRCVPGVWNARFQNGWLRWRDAGGGARWCTARGCPGWGCPGRCPGAGNAWCRARRRRARSILCVARCARCLFVRGCLSVLCVYSVSTLVCVHVCVCVCVVRVPSAASRPSHSNSRRDESATHANLITCLNVSNTVDRPVQYYPGTYCSTRKPLVLFKLGLKKCSRPGFLCSTKAAVSQWHSVKAT